MRRWTLRGGSPRGYEREAQVHPAVDRALNHIRRRDQETGPAHLRVSAPSRIWYGPDDAPRLADQVRAAFKGIHRPVPTPGSCKCKVEAEDVTRVADTHEQFICPRCTARWQGKPL